MDKYDEQIQELSAHPERIYDHWSSSKGLFRILDNSPEGQWHARSGCLTMIRDIYRMGSFYQVIVGGQPDEEMTEAIRADERLPDNPRDVKPEHLPVFAEWQRKFDERLAQG